MREFLLNLGFVPGSYAVGVWFENTNSEYFRLEIKNNKYVIVGLMENFLSYGSDDCTLRVLNNPTEQEIESFIKLLRRA